MKEHLEEHLYNPNLYYDSKNPKSCCTLNALGMNFDPDAFLSESGLSQVKGLIKGIIGLPDEIREKIKRKELPGDAKEKIELGELTGEEFFKAFEIFETPFLLISISEKTGIKAQFEDAILFLKKHSDDLLKLRIYSNVENISISFLAEDYDSIEHDKLPEELLDLLNKINIPASFGQSVESGDNP